MGRLLRRAVAVVVPLSAVVASSSCLPRSGTDVGNGLTVKLNLQAAPELVAAQTRALAGGVTIDQLWVTTQRFRLTPGTECAKPAPHMPKIDIPGPAYADLLGAGFVGGPRMFDTKTGAYCKLEFEFDDAKKATLPAEAPPELADAAVFLRGRRGDGVVFTVRSRAKEALKLDAKDGSFELGGQAQSLVVGFDLEEAIAALALESADGDPIVFDDTHNEMKLKAFEKVIRSSAKLFVDDDADGKLSPDEVDDEHELGGGGAD